MTKQYFLYRENNEKVISVLPLENGLNVVGNFTGAYFVGPTKEMTDEELMHFKSIHNLYYEQELGSQMNIFDL